MESVLNVDNVDSINRMRLYIQKELDSAIQKKYELAGMKKNFGEETELKKSRLEEYKNKINEKINKLYDKLDEKTEEFDEKIDELDQKINQLNDLLDDQADEILIYELEEEIRRIDSGLA